MPRSKTLVAILIAFLIAGNGVLLATGTVSRREELRERRARLSTELITTSRELGDLQKASDDSRTAVLGAMDSMNELLNLARDVQQIEEAAVRFPEVTSQMDLARRANIRLPDQTARLLMFARDGLNSISELREVTKNPNERMYLDSLDAALELLIQTHQVYSLVNDGIAELMKKYEELFRITDEFMKQRDNFRTTREAARVIDSRTSNLIIDVTRSRAELVSIQSDAERLAARTTEAFVDARRFNTN